MRIKITLKYLGGDGAVPINYQYPVACAIYKIISQAEPEFAELLHTKGYPTEHKRRFKYFTFSKLFFKYPAVVTKNLLIMDENNKPFLLISSPLDETFVKSFVVGLFESQELPIGLKNVCHSTFGVELVESLPEPVFRETTKCKALSPVTVSLNTNNDTPDYLRALDPRLSNAVKQNLLWKYKTLYDSEPEDKDLIFEVDKDYISSRGGEERVSKLITIKETGMGETKVKSFITPFTLSGSIDLIKLAYTCGIGEKNSMGFGMWEISS